MGFSRKHRIAALVLLVIAGFALRAYDLSAAGLSEDEVQKVDAARAYLHGDFSKNLEHPMLMKLQVAACLVATDAWNDRFGREHPIPEEVPVRLPNAIFGALMTVVLYLFAELTFGSGVALIAAALWATGVSAITVNRIAKEDTLLVVFCWLGFYFYERAKRFGAAETRAQFRLYGLAGASFGLMLASKYFPHYFGLLFLFYHLVGRNETNQPLTKRDYAWFYGAFLIVFVLVNPTVVLPSTWMYFAAYTQEQTLTHHGYVLMGRLYPNNFSATPGGLPIYFYPLLLAIKTPLPVLASFLVGLWVSVRRRRQAGYFFLLFMFVMWIVPYSLFASKWLRYILSLLPVIYMLSAVGIVEALRWAARRFELAAAERRALALACAGIFVVVPIASAAASAPYYSLYLNPLGLGRTGYFFPHDEFYDAGLREAIKGICDEAPPGVLVLGEAPPVFRYYFHRFGRDDLRFLQISELTAADQAESPSYVVVQDGRRYFENVAYIDDLESHRRPTETIVIEGADAAKVYRVKPAEVSSVR